MRKAVSRIRGIPAMAGRLRERGGDRFTRAAHAEAVISGRFRREMMEYFIYLVAAAAIVFAWYLISTTIDRMPGRQEKAMQKAIAQGHVVSAVFVRSYRKEKGNGKQCDYKYEVDGKTYRRSIFTDNPPETLQLYYVRNPKNANIASAINVSEKNWPLRFAILAAIIILIAKVLI